MTTAAADALLRDLAGTIPVRPNPRRRQLWAACMAVGLAAFTYLLLTQPQRGWGAFAVNVIFWLGIAMGGSVLAAAIRLANGRWAAPVTRIAESYSAFLPYGLGAMAVLLGAGVWTYLPWTHHVEPRVKLWLNLPFLYARTLLGLGLFTWLAWDQARTSLRSDAHLLLNHVAPELKPDYEKLSAGWRGDAAEAAWRQHRLAQRAPQIALVFAVSVTLLAWDFIMGLTPEWVSNLFGWWVFMGAFLSGIAMTALLATRLRTALRLEAWVTDKHFWDLGKILFAISIFWVYQFWSQYLPIWYANMPEETWWVFVRFEDPWRPIAFTVFTMVFLIPFVGLMNMHSKRNPVALALFSLVVMAGMWLERHLLVMPSLHPESVWIGLPEVGVTLGFLGLFAWRVQSFLARYPAVNVTEALASAGGSGH